VRSRQRRRAAGAGGYQHPRPLALGERLREHMAVAEVARSDEAVGVVGEAANVARAAVARSACSGQKGWPSRAVGQGRGE
jgi:hypothetical protein